MRWRLTAPGGLGRKFVEVSQLEIVMSHRPTASWFSPTRRVTTAALTLLLLLQTTGCVWHPVTNPIPTLQRAKPTDDYRVTLVTGEVIQLTKLRVQGDSLFGMADSTKFVRGSLEAVPYPVGIPAAQVLRAERHSVSGLSYVAFVFGSLAVAGFISLLSW